MQLGEPGEHPAQCGQVEPGAVHSPGQQRGQRLAITGDTLGLGEGLAHQPAAPQGQPAAEPVVRRDAGPDPLHDEGGLPGVLQRADDHLAGLGIEVGRDLAVEVRGEPVADVGLDQPFVEVGRRGVGVEAVEAGAEGLHRLGRIGTQLRQPADELLQVPELCRGHRADRDLVVDPGRHLGVLDQSLERGELAVGDRPEEVDGGAAVVLVGRFSHARSLAIGSGRPSRRRTDPVAACMCAVGKAFKSG